MRLTHEHLRAYFLERLSRFEHFSITVKLLREKDAPHRRPYVIVSVNYGYHRDEEEGGRASHIRSLSLYKGTKQDKPKGTLAPFQGISLRGLTAASATQRLLGLLHQYARQGFHITRLSP